MTDLDALKQRADALGIKYRSDIKIETLKAKIDSAGIEEITLTEPTVVKAVPTRQQDYQNTGTINLFTESGKCSPGKSVSLTQAQASAYKDLELCQS